MYNGRVNKDVSRKLYEFKQKMQQSCIPSLDNTFGVIATSFKKNVDGNMTTDYWISITNLANYARNISAISLWGYRHIRTSSYLPRRISCTYNYDQRLDKI